MTRRYKHLLGLSVYNGEPLAIGLLLIIIRGIFRLTDWGRRVLQNID